MAGRLTWNPGFVANSLIFGYLLLTLLLGLYANRRLTIDMEDFFLYGRKAGFVVMYLTMVGNVPFLLRISSAREVFSTRTASGSGTPAPGRFSSAPSPTSSARGIWALGKRFGYVTPADLLSDFYESEAVRVVVAIVSVVFTILYIQVQAQGLGYIISVASDDRISFELGTLILLVVAAVYLAAGGLRAVY